MKYNTAVPCLFIMEPIGINGALEAVDVLHFCSDDCRTVIRENTAHLVKEGESRDYISRTQCDECGVILPDA